MHSSRFVARQCGAAAVLAIVIAVALAASDPSNGASPAQAVQISIDKFSFAPKEITIEPETRIVWTNHDETPHTVASNDKSFASKGLDTDDKFEHTFDREGDFGYICTVHPFMAGVVHVRKR